MPVIIWSKGMRWIEQRHACRRREMNTEFRWGNLKWRDRPLGIPRRRWGDNIKKRAFKKWLEHVDWVCMTRDRDKRRALVNMAMIFFRVFIPTGAQHIDIEICNPLASLLHVSAYFGCRFVSLQLHVYVVISLCCFFICRIPLRR
jgi:hypothetical protein